MNTDEKALAKYRYAQSVGVSEAVLREKIKLLETALLNTQHVGFSYYMGGPGLTHGQAAHRATTALKEALKKHAWAAIQRVRGMGE
ncbi:MAG: hypothetical protein JWR51_4672 [Devosia sp.]|uniref:hypothetical protein n=1 Tax=Devosia sp. TaxID=1871048 RepID=UPI00260DCFAB|nr:hypothetical protein [Devosia sp.]MDB5531569.1 hypothetical protein [Devosia sp.]